MAMSITLKDELYSQVVERAQAANTSPEEWLDKVIALQVRRETAAETLERISAGNSAEMARRGLKPSDVEKEIEAHRRTR